MGLQRATRDVIERSVSRKENFKRGNVWGKWEDKNAFRSTHIAMLPPEFAKVLVEHSSAGELFVLYSYQTPMAWYRLNDSANPNGDGKWYYVDYKYSASTGWQQAAYRYALKGENVVTLTSILDNAETGVEVAEDEKEYY